MNTAGSIRPLAGCCQRSRASTANGVPESSSTQRLIVDGQFVAAQRALQVGFELRALDQCFLHGRLERDTVAATAVLGAVHGEVGVTQQLVGVAGLCVGVPDADRGADEDDLPLDPERTPHRRDDPFRHLASVDNGVSRLQQDREFVTAETRGGVRRACTADDPLCRPAEQLVAGGRARAVVDGLEAIEVDEQHGHGVS